MSNPRAIILDSGGKDSCLARLLTENHYDIVARVTMTYGGKVWQHDRSVPSACESLPIDSICSAINDYDCCSQMPPLVKQRAIDYSASVVILGAVETLFRYQIEYARAGFLLVCPLRGLTKDRIIAECASRGIEYITFPVLMNGVEHIHSEVTNF